MPLEIGRPWCPTSNWNSQSLIQTNPHVLFLFLGHPCLASLSKGCGGRRRPSVPPQRSVLSRNFKTDCCALPVGQLGNQKVPGKSWPGIFLVVVMSRLVKSKLDDRVGVCSFLAVAVETKLSQEKTQSRIAEIAAQEINR